MKILKFRLNSFRKLSALIFLLSLCMKPCAKNTGFILLRVESQIFAVLADKFLAKSFAVTEGYPLVKSRSIYF